MNGKKSNAKFLVVAVIAFVSYFVVSHADKLEENGLLLPVIALVFILGFGFLGYRVAKLWKQPDEEVFKELPPIDGGIDTKAPQKQPTLMDRGIFFVGAIMISLHLIVQEKQVNAGALIFCGIVLLSACAYFFPALIQKLRGKEGQPLFPKAKLQPLQIFLMFFGLIGVCFACFWCYLMITKGIWWLSFPGFIIGAAFARFPVAGLRILLRSAKDPGESHLNRQKDTDPWDRPDKKY